MAEPPGAPGADPGASAAESIAVLREPSSRLLQPVRYGGRAVSRSSSEAVDFVAAVADLAERDGSVGWFAAAVNTSAYGVAGLGDAAAERVWGADTGALVAACEEPTGRLTAEAGQFRLTGRWESVTGALSADWLLLNALDGDSVRCVLLPRDAVRVDHQAGLRGLDAAGIGDVAVSDAIVDAQTVFPNPDDSSCATGELDDEGPPYGILAGAARAAAVIGAASGVWQAHVGQVRRRLATSYGSEDTTELTASAVLVAKAESDIDAARLQLVTALSADAAGAAPALRQAVTRARNAADQLLSSGSRHALDATDPVARLWLDVLAGYRLTIRRIGGDPSAG
jgi:3-hydroxy-9,10-secoandrosta-1,3,5(10)-triene-9,17-dione monooxygenase